MRQLMRGIPARGAQTGDEGGLFPQRRPPRPSKVGWPAVGASSSSDRNSDPSGVTRGPVLAPSGVCADRARPGGSPPHGPESLCSAWTSMPSPAPITWAPLGPLGILPRSPPGRFALQLSGAPAFGGRALGERWACCSLVLEGLERVSGGLLCDCGARGRGRLLVVAATPAPATEVPVRPAVPSERDAAPVLAA